MKTSTFYLFLFQNYSSDCSFVLIKLIFRPKTDLNFRLTTHNFRWYFALTLLRIMNSLLRTTNDTKLLQLTYRSLNNTFSTIFKRVLADAIASHANKRRPTSQHMDEHVHTNTHKLVFRLFFIVLSAAASWFFSFNVNQDKFRRFYTPKTICADRFKDCYYQKRSGFRTDMFFIYIANDVRTGS